MIDHFDDKLLKFIYLLTREQSYLNSIDASSHLSKFKFRVTDRTIRRWINFLKTKGFQYFPSPKYDSLGLDYSVVILFGVRDEKIFDIIPYDMYIDKVMSFSRYEHAFVGYYTIPFGNEGRFSKFWKRAKELGIIDDYILMNSKAATFLFSPFHKIIKNGIITFDEITEKDNEYFIRLLEKNINYIPAKEIHPAVRKNPFLVPVMLEYYRKHISSIGVWREIKRKLGNKVWTNYLDKFNKNPTDGRGVFAVQQILRQLKNNPDFVQQIRVIYDMVYTAHNISMVYVYMKLKHLEDVVSLTRKLSKSAVHMNISLPKDNSQKEVLIYIVTNNKHIVNIMGTCLEFARSKPQVFINDFNYSKKFWTEERFGLDYPKLFDPLSCKWRYNHNAYMKKLEKLAH